MLIAKEYAEALFACGLEKDRAKAYGQALGTAKTLFQAEPKYIDLLAAPDLSKAAKHQLIDEAFGSYDSDVKNFLKLLADKRRIAMFASCEREYQKLLFAYENTTAAKVTSAVALTADERERLTQKLVRKFGKQVVLTCEVDPDVLGGLCVRIDGMALDGTLRTRLNEAKDMMSNEY